MYLKSKEGGAGGERAFPIGGTTRKKMLGKNGKHVRGPVSSLVLHESKKGDQLV